MRAPLTVDVLAGQRAIADKIELADVEVAILQTHVPVLRKRSAHAGEGLPRKVRVRVVCAAEACRRDGVLDVGDADTAADESLHAVVAAEVQQAVDHVAQCVRAAVQRVGGAVSGRTAAVGEAASACAAVADFGFEAEAAEVITDNTTYVITCITLQSGGVGDASNCQVRLFDDHRASIDLDVPGILLGQRRRCERRRCQGQAHEQFPHSHFPFIRSHASGGSAISGSRFCLQANVSGLCGQKATKTRTLSNNPEVRGLRMYPCCADLTVEASNQERAPVLRRAAKIAAMAERA